MILDSHFKFRQVWWQGSQQPRLNKAWPVTVGMEEYPEDTPPLIDDFSQYLPKSLPPSDLSSAVGLSGDINMIVAEVARKTGAKSAIMPIYGPKQMPRPAAGDH